MKQILFYIFTLVLTLPAFAQSISSEDCEKDGEVVFTRECIAQMLGEDQPPLANMPISEESTTVDQGQTVEQLPAEVDQAANTTSPKTEKTQTTRANTAEPETQPPVTKISNNQPKTQCSTREFMQALEASDQRVLALCELTNELIKSTDTRPERKGRTPLHWSVLTGNIDMLQTLLAAGANPDSSSRQDLNATPLHIAVLKTNLQAVLLLINADANLNANNLLKETPLHLAIRAGEFEIAETLMSAGANIEARDRTGKTPLLTASLGSSKDMLNLLLESGANLYAKTRQGNSVLHYSVLISSDTTEQLINAGAKLDVVNNKGETPLQRLMASILPQHQKTLKILIDRATATEKKRLSKELFKSALESNDLVVFTNLLNNGFNPEELSLADLKDKPAFIRALQSNGWLSKK